MKHMKTLMMKLMKMSCKSLTKCVLMRNIDVNRVFEIKLKYIYEKKIEWYDLYAQKESK